MAYKGLKIKVGTADAYDTVTKYGIYVQSFPYIPVPVKAKNISSQSWYDQNGDDDYIPSVLYYDPISITIPFVVKGYLSVVTPNIKAFLSELRSAIFSFYDVLAKEGRQSCIVEEYPQEASVLTLDGLPITVEEIEQQPVCVVFNVKIKINDPVTNIQL